MKLKRKNKYAVGQIIGAGMQVGDMIGKPIRAGAEQIDPNTGEYINYDKAVRNASAGSIWAPHKAITESLGDPNASAGEKALSFTSLLGIPGLSKMWAKKRYSRLEKENKERVWNANNPNTFSSPDNPYYMAQGGVTGEYAELEDGEPFMTPDGNIEMVNGNTHAQGGEDYMLPEGTAILGKNESKIFGEKFKVLGEKLKKAQDKHQKILDSNANPIARRSSMLMLDRIEKEYKALVNEQEMAKVGAANKQFAKGGIVRNKKYYDGGISRMQEMLNRDYQAPVFNEPSVNRPDISGFNEATTAMDTQGAFLRNNRLSNTLGTIGQLAPIAYNLGEGMFGKPEKYDYNKYLNPYIGDIRSAMRNRRYNIQPELEANRLAQAVYNRNILQGGFSPSQLQGGLQSGAISRMRADSGVRAQQQNINNDYLAQQAQMDYNLGENISKLKNYGYEMNLKNRAAKKNYMSAGLSQLQQYAQVQQLMKNQKMSDKEKLNLLKDIIPNYFYTPGIGYEQKN